jgi:hypothetical protein
MIVRSSTGCCLPRLGTQDAASSSSSLIGTSRQNSPHTTPGTGIPGLRLISADARHAMKSTSGWSPLSWAPTETSYLTDSCRFTNRIRFARDPDGIMRIGPRGSGLRPTRQSAAYAAWRSLVVILQCGRAPALGSNGCTYAPTRLPGSGSPPARSGLQGRSDSPSLCPWLCWRRPDVVTGGFRMCRARPSRVVATAQVAQSRFRGAGSPCRVL